jgi:hypothetical protein
MPRDPIAQKERSLAGILFVLGLMGLVRLAFGVVFLLFVYGLVVIVFRHAFGVHLWNPFGG